MKDYSESKWFCRIKRILILCIAIYWSISTFALFSFIGLEIPKYFFIWRMSNYISVPIFCVLLGVFVILFLLGAIVFYKKQYTSFTFVLAFIFLVDSFLQLQFIFRYFSDSYTHKVADEMFSNYVPFYVCKIVIRLLISIGLIYYGCMSYKLYKKVKRERFLDSKEV